MTKSTVEVEINGVKMEVDLRHARRIETLVIGSKVKVLIKKYEGFDVFPGVIAGFEPFQKLPTITVAYITSGYGGGELKFLHYNSSVKEAEIVAAVDEDFSLNKADVVAYFNREINKKRAELEELENKRAYVEREFAQFWGRVEC